MSVTTPTGVLVGTYKDKSPEWYAARANRIGGSEIAAILGLSKYQSAFSLWHVKAGMLEENRENEEMHAGKVLEPVILAEWERKQEGSLYLLNGGKPCGTFVHQDRPWQMANVDSLAVRLASDGSRRLIDVVGGVEAKFALYADGWGTPGTDEIPPYYLTQVRWYCDVLGLPWFDLEVFVGSQGQFRTYRIMADEADQKMMRDKAKAFLDTLPGGPNEQRPDIDGHTATYEAVRKQHPEIEREQKVELPAELARSFCRARTALADTEALERKTRALVLDVMGDARVASFDGKTIATRQPTATGGTKLVAGRSLPDFSEEAA